MIELGKEGRDKITGFKGIVTGMCQYLYGCTRYLLNPKVSKDGKINEPEWFDDGRIEIIGRGITPKSVQSKKPGGDRNPPKN
jgi:hypothetical protein